MTNRILLTVSLLSGVLTLGATPALADEPATAAAPGGDAPPEEPKVKATAFALSHPDVDEETMLSIMKSIEAGLKKNTRLDMKDLDARLADNERDAPGDQIEAARSALTTGQTALTELRIPEAVKSLDQAVTGLASVLPFIKKQELADAQAFLAVARFQSGYKKGGREVFVELVTWRPDYTYDVARFPPEFVGDFDEAQRQVEKARKSTLAIKSDPPGAQAYVDGKYIGVTPCTADGQPVGKHYVTLKREGYKKAVAPVMVTKKGDALAEIPIERLQRYLLVEQARGKVEATMGKEVLDENAEDFKAELTIEHGVFVKAAPDGSKVGVDAWLYDLSTRRRLSHVHEVIKKGSREEIDKQLAPVAEKLYVGVNYEGGLVQPKDEPLPSNVPPIYKTWRLWAPIGAVLVVAGGVVGAYYGVKSTADPACPADTANCFSFQP